MPYTTRETYNFISHQTNDPIVEWKTCKVSGQPFPITQKDLDFYDKVSPIFNGVKYLIPTPTLCPEERQRRRLAFRNERTLYKRVSDFNGKSLVSNYSPDKPYKIYTPEQRRGDERDPLEYGKDVDFTMSFLQQFNTLREAVPQIGLWQMSEENAVYNNNCYHLKNSYMNFNTDFGENCFYCYVGEYCTNTVDCSYIYHSENCYECFDVRNGFNCFFCNSVEKSSDCYFSSDLIGCSFCWGSYGLRNASYVRNNQHKTKEEWLTLFTQQHRSDLVQTSLQAYKEMLRTKSQRTLTLSNTENCVGDYLYFSKELQFCYDMVESEHCKYTTYAAFHTKDVYDCNALGDVELCYETNEGGVGVRNCCFIKNPMEGLFKSFYCVYCVKNCANLFGCVGLRGKEYCILNKQYTKEEYEALVPKIIEKMKADGEWGEFFPTSMSPFGYNETLANDYFPLTKEEALQRGYKRSEYENPLPKVEKVIEANHLPADTTQVSDDILKWAIKCETTDRPFILLKPEVEFYRKYALPIPHKHPDQRYRERMTLRHPRELHKRTCSSCGKEMISVYPVEDTRKIYCEACYQKEIYG